eukprot:155879-Amphidinium_carterae.1
MFVWHVFDVGEGVPGCAVQKSPKPRSTRGSWSVDVKLWVLSLSLKKELLETVGALAGTMPGQTPPAEDDEQAWSSV